ncbi:Hypothetical protein ACI5QM_01209 [Bacillus subtilis]
MSNVFKRKQSLYSEIINNIELSKKFIVVYYYNHFAKSRIF